MANVQVSRQVLDPETNQVGWVIQTVDETSLQAGEVPYEQPTLFEEN